MTHSAVNTTLVLFIRLWGAWGAQNGEKVVYSKYAGTELKMANTEYVLLKVTTLTCIVGCSWTGLRTRVTRFD